MINENEIARELNAALERDMPGAKLAHKPFTGNGAPKEPEPTVSAQIDAVIAGMELRIAMLRRWKETL